MTACWREKCKKIPPDRTLFLSPQQMTVGIRTGIQDNIFRLTVMNEDGNQSNTVELTVLPLRQEEMTAVIPSEPAMVLEEMESAAPPTPSQTTTTAIKQIYPPTAEERANRHYQQGIEAYQQGDPGQAEKLWRSALQQSRQHHRSREALSTHLIATGRVLEAQQLLEEGITVAEEWLPYHLLLAQIALDSGHSAAALLRLQQVVVMNDQLADVHASIASIYLQLGEKSGLQESANSYQRALELQPDNGSWWVGLAIAQRLLGANKEAINAYQQALRLPSLPPTLRSYARKQRQQLQQLAD
ncbi:MAG: tetratricopeptide repeat protein [Gammaproteobacteria bacterium]|nr:tetratricopeptide repeat protein [Gammaproteobacteria bacterium]